MSAQKTLNDFLAITSQFHERIHYSSAFADLNLPEVLLDDELVSQIESKLKQIEIKACTMDKQVVINNKAIFDSALAFIGELEDQSVAVISFDYLLLIEEKTKQSTLQSDFYVNYVGVETDNHPFSTFVFVEDEASKGKLAYILGELSAEFQTHHVEIKSYLKDFLTAYADHFVSE